MGGKSDLCIDKINNKSKETNNEPKLSPTFDPNFLLDGIQSFDQMDQIKIFHCNILIIIITFGEKKTLVQAAGLSWTDHQKLELQKF